MNKQYIAIYNYKKYSIQDIKDMIEPYKVRYWHQSQTWDEPEDEGIDYKFDISAAFDKAVKIICVEFKDGDDEFGQYVQFNEGLKFRIVQEGYSWFDCIQSYGWDTFVEIKDLEDFQNSEMKVRLELDSWIDSVAEENAWKVVENGEAHSW